MTTAQTIELKPIVKTMFSRELFRLDPTKAQAYFAKIADLQPQPADRSWEQTFQGPSKLPWLESALIELHEVDGQWTLGQSQITWRPPEAQARALYDRLVAEVQAARGRKPDFGRDESKGERQQRHLGWSWCKDTCQAIVELASTGQGSLVESPHIDEHHPAVQLSVFTPEGP